MAVNGKQSGWVLGGSGFLGTHVVRMALAQGNSVTCVSREPAKHGGVASLPLDLTPPTEEFEEALAAQRPDWVINCVALPSVADCEADPERAACLNRDLPARLGRIARAGGIRLVHISTDNVFDGEPPRSTGFREDDETRPLSIYGATKRDGELALIREDPQALIVRLPLLFGDSGGRGLGASDSLLAAIERGERPGLFTDEFRSPLDVADAARALVEWANSPLHGLLHLAGSERLTRYELGVRVLRAAGEDPSQIQAASQRDSISTPPRPRDLTLDGSRALGSLGFRPANP